MTPTNTPTRTRTPTPTQTPTPTRLPVYINSGACVTWKYPDGQPRGPECSQPSICGEPRRVYLPLLLR